MNMKLIISRFLLAAFIGSVIFLYHPARLMNKLTIKTNINGFNKAGESREIEENEEFAEQRLRHEFEMLRNPVTGQIPKDFHQIELQAASKIPSKGNFYNPLLSRINSTNSLNGTGSVLNQNTYVPVGPSNQA